MSPRSMPAGRTPIVVAGCGLLGVVLLGCGGDDGSSGTPATTTSIVASAPVIDPGDGGSYAPVIDPAEFSATIDNPFLPFAPGRRWVYRSEATDGEVEMVTVEVLDERRIVMGVETLVVHDVVTVDGEVIEDTFDWFAQDAEGAVWYFGEDTTSYEDGVASSEGAWEAGVDGALPGIVMPATPEVSDVGYRQEYAPGEAEDMAQVIATTGSVTTPYDRFDDVIVTREWTPLEPDVVEEKSYARGIGLVQEITTQGDGAPVELVELAESG